MFRFWVTLDDLIYYYLKRAPTTLPFCAKDAPHLLRITQDINTSYTSEDETTPETLDVTVLFTIVPIDDAVVSGTNMQNCVH